MKCQVITPRDSGYSNHKNATRISAQKQEARRLKNKRFSWLTVKYYFL